MPIPAQNAPPRHLGLSADAGLVVLSVIWGVNFVVMKAAFDEIGPLGFNAFRFPLAALTIGVLLHIQGRRVMPGRGDWGIVALLGGIGHVAYQVVFIYGLALTLAGNAALLLATAPVWIILLSAVRREDRVTGPLLAGVAATLAGIFLLIIGGSGEIGGSTWGDLLIVAAAILWALYTVLSRGPILRHGPLEVTGWTLWVGTPVIIALGIPQMSREVLASMSLATWGLVLYSGVLAVALAYFLWYRAVALIGQNRSSVYGNLIPVVALFAAWLWLGEVPTPIQLAGVVIILAGVFLARGKRRRRPKRRF